MFTSLKIKNFRIYWFGMLVSVVGTWIQITAQGWLVYDLSKSAFLLGLVGFISYIPIFIFSLFGGAIADRVEKKNLLLVTQIVFLLLAFFLAVMTQLGIIKVWHIMIIALLNGLVMSFDMPTRQAIVLDLVGKEHLLNAVALNSAAFNMARIVGPALAGILIASVGTAGCFYINSVTFLAVIIALLVIRLSSQNGQKIKTHIFEDIKSGLKYMFKNKIVRTLIIMVGIPSLFGISYIILMPIFAQEVFARGAKGLGWLMSANGVGALIGALMLARLGDYQHKGRILIVAPIVFSLGLICFAGSTHFWLSIFFLLFVGWGGLTSMATINTILQLTVPNELRGRVMSMFMLTFAGLMPLGNLFAGTLSQYFGVQTVLTAGGFICLFAFSLIFISEKGIAKL